MRSHCCLIIASMSIVATLAHPMHHGREASFGEWLDPAEASSKEQEACLLADTAAQDDTTTQETRPPRASSMFRWKNPLERIRSPSAAFRSRSKKQGEASSAMPETVSSPLQNVLSIGEIQEQEGELIPENFYLEGDATGPYQKLFSKIFPLRARQLLLAIRYGADILVMEADQSNAEGQEYRQARLMLHLMHPESIKADAELEMHPRGNMEPFFTRLTNVLQSPERQYRTRSSIREAAEYDSKALVKYAKKLGFNVIDLDKPLCRAYSWEPDQNS